MTELIRSNSIIVVKTGPCWIRIPCARNALVFREQVDVHRRLPTVAEWQALGAPGSRRRAAARSAVDKLKPGRGVAGKASAQGCGPAIAQVQAGGHVGGDPGTVGVGRADRGGWVATDADAAAGVGAARGLQVAGRRLYIVFKCDAACGCNGFT